MLKEGQLPDGPGPAWDAEQLAVALAVARSRARRGRRRLSLSIADQADLQQDILVVLLERQHRYEPSRGCWAAFAQRIAQRYVGDRARALRRGSAFVEQAVDIDQYPAGSSITQQDQPDHDLAWALERVAADLPPAHRSLLQLLMLATDVATAQRQSQQSCATFYRELTDLRRWLRAAGLRPRHAGSARPRSVGSAEKNLLADT